MAVGLILYTDGSCRDNVNVGPDNPAFYAYVLVWRGLNPFDHDDGVVLATGRGPVQLLHTEASGLVGTNNTAELAAIIYGLRHTRNLFPKRQIIVYTDSQYAINVSKMAEDRVSEAANESLVRLLRRTIDGNTTMLHIRGHQGIRFNEMADKLAKGELWIGTPSSNWQ